MIVAGKHRLSHYTPSPQSNIVMALIIIGFINQSGYSIKNKPQCSQRHFVAIVIGIADGMAEWDGVPDVADTARTRDGVEGLGRPVVSGRWLMQCWWPMANAMLVAHG